MRGIQQVVTVDRMRNHTSTVMNHYLRIFVRQNIMPLKYLAKKETSETL